MGIWINGADFAFQFFVDDPSMKKGSIMIQIAEKCLRSLDEEPGGAMCILYRYRVSDEHFGKLLRIRHGSAVIEFMSDHQLQPQQLSIIFGVSPDSIKVIQQEPGSASADNAVPG
jgi:hypothetical protein